VLAHQREGEVVRHAEELAKPAAVRGAARERFVQRVSIAPHPTLSDVTLDSPEDKRPTA